MIRWEEPPVSVNGRWHEVVEELKRNPGRWALIEEGLTEKYGESSLRASFRRWGCQVKTRRLEGGTSVWARWPEEG